MGWWLGVALVAAAAGLGWRWRWGASVRGGPAPSTPVPPSGTFVLEGRIRVRSDCGAGLAGLPRSGRVAAALGDGRRWQDCEAPVELAPTADDPDTLAGSYRLEVTWPGPRAPTAWRTPRALSDDGSDVCEGLACEGHTRCANLASRPRQVDVTGLRTEHLLAVACICVPD